MKFTKLAAAVTLGLVFSAAQAATVTDTFQVKIHINDTCDATTFAAQTISDIDFGNRAVTDTATSAIYANNASGTTLSVTCNTGVAFDVGLTPSNTNTAGAGVMVNTPPTDSINYQLYQPSATNAPATATIWGNTLSNNTVARTGTGSAINLPVSAGIATGGLAGKVGGAYADTVTATLTY